MKKLVSLLLPLIGVAIFAWVVRGVGVHNLLETFRGLDRNRLAVFPVLVAYLIWIRGVRWRHLMRMIGIDYPLHRAMLIWTVGFAAASITPGKVGDAMRAYYLSKDTGRNLGEAFLTVFMDRLLDLLTILITGAITVLIFSYYYTNLPNIGIVVVAVLGIIALIYVGLQGKLMKKLLRPAFNLIAPDRYKKELSTHFNSFYQPLGSYVRDWKRTSVAILYTILFWAGVVTLAYASTWVLNIDVSVWFVLLVMPMLTLAEILPISISGIGTRDATAVYLFSFVGISSAQAVGFSLLYVLVGTYLVAAVGFIAWLLKPARFKATAAG